MKIDANERREKSNAIIKSMGVACFEQLPLLEDSTQVTLKSTDHICKRAIASLFTTQVACDIAKDDYEESVKFFKPFLEKYGVNEELNALEQRIFNGTYSEQDAINADWEYETYWSLVWALGLIDDISDASAICDCEKAVHLVSNTKDFESFKNQCQLRDIEEILDMLDLYYRYHWATTEQRIRPQTPIGNLNPSVVVERRRGLEWLISPEKDWYDISLDT